MASNAVELTEQVPADDFQALEEKVYRTIEMYKAARQAHTAAERDAQRLRQQLQDRDGELATLRRETVQLGGDPRPRREDAPTDRDDCGGQLNRLLRPARPGEGSLYGYSDEGSGGQGRSELERASGDF